MWAQVAGSVGGGESFGSNSLIGAMQPVISAINRSLGVMHESFRYANGAPFGERNLVPVEARATAANHPAVSRKNYESRR
jgi:hypothetical protein